jgi:potassium efflux system protein
VPNKDLISGRLLNWTLTDPMNRVVVNVGIAYGSDTEQACQLLLEAAREQPHVLDDPPPVAFFDSFGDSSLNLKLMCFLPNLENRLTTVHSLHSAIDRKFKDAGLEIPFPQRDLNVRISRDALRLDLLGANVIVGDGSVDGKTSAGRRASEDKRQGAA